MSKVKSVSIEKRMLGFIIAGMTFLCFFLLFGVKVHAAEGFDLYTMSPGINVTAGDSVSYSLYLTGSEAAGKDVDLSIESIPDGFSGYFKNENYEVTKVHANGDSETAVATFQVTTPKEAPNGNNEIVLKAQTEDGFEDYLTLEINISELKSGESNFTVEYPDQEGATGTVFSYSTTIINNSLNKQNYNFSSNAPSGWEVIYTSDGKQVSSLDIDSGDSAGVTIQITPPDKVVAGDYKISCAATSAKESLKADLNVTILGTYALEVTTSDGNLALDAYANKASDVTLLVKNTGNIDLKNIALTSQANSDWTVTFDESTIESLEAGASKEVKAHITPGNDSITGDYLTNIVATFDDHSSTAQLRVTVKTSTGWGIFALVIICAVVGGLWYTIRKYGRR